MRRSLLTAAGVLLVAIAALAQRPRLLRLRLRRRDAAIHNVPYDGQFTFVRVKYETAPGGFWAGGRPVLGARLSDRRAEPDADHERHQFSRRACRTKSMS